MHIKKGVRAFLNPTGPNQTSTDLKGVNCNMNTQKVGKLKLFQ